METVKKNLIFVLFFCMCYSLFSTFYIVYFNSRQSMMSELYRAESRILRDELNEMKYKPTYENGYSDAIIKMGVPTNPTSYTDGFMAAAKIYQNANYADGYHNAIKQFGYANIPNANISLPNYDVRNSKIRIAEEK